MLQVSKKKTDNKTMHTQNTVNKSPQVCKSARKVKKHLQKFETFNQINS